MNMYKWPEASLSLTSALSALGKPLGVRKSANKSAIDEEKGRRLSSALGEDSRRPLAAFRRDVSQQDDDRCPVWYASRHAEGSHVVPPGHNEGLDTRYGGELPA